MIVDSHFHAWTEECPLATEHSYKPVEAKPIDTCFEIHDAHGVTHGVLVQPSFLGFDNRYILDCLRQFPDRLRASVVVGPDVGEKQLEEMDALGVVGLRLNLISAKTILNHQSPHIFPLYEWAAAHNWHVEVFADGAIWADVAARLLPFGVTIVADHFGMPNAALDPEDIGHKAILKAAETGKVWTKFSGFYRPKVPDLAPYAARLLEACGPDKIVWASDFPWTGHETLHPFQTTLDNLGNWVEDPALRAKVMGENAANLFRF